MVMGWKVKKCHLSLIIVRFGFVTTGTEVIGIIFGFSQVGMHLHRKIMAVLLRELCCRGEHSLECSIHKTQNNFFFFLLSAYVIGTK